MNNTIRFYNLKWSDGDEDVLGIGLRQDDLIKFFNIDISQTITKNELKKITDYYFVDKDLPTLLSYDYELINDSEYERFLYEVENGLI
tara:strand:+ start:421 stop:684 length:264 start_codon:yes stop_codon:yes gene_type:complete